MALRDCSFETCRLFVGDWDQLLGGDSAETVRDDFVMSLLTDAVTRDLPPTWQGQYSLERAASWYAERENESTVRLIADRADGHPVGLLILFESNNHDGASDIRVGYVIAESAWGEGFATEVVAGLVDWCRDDGTTHSLIGGVADHNSASARVLLKNGFVRNRCDTDHPDVGREYTLLLRS